MTAPVHHFVQSPDTRFVQSPDTRAGCMLLCLCVADDKSWVHKALVAGQEPVNSLQALKDAEAKAAADEAAKKEAAEKEAAAAKEAATKKAAADAAAAAAANAAAANDATREVQTEVPKTGAAQQSWGMDLKDSTSGQAEAAQQRQWRAIIAQAASWGTIICIAGLLGLVVLWQMRSASNGPLMGRRWGRYTALQRRPPSPAPADRMV